VQQGCSKKKRSYDDSFITPLFYWWAMKESNLQPTD
jgi:hypothetical protein